jgi:chromosome segregation ATPase
MKDQMQHSSDMTSKKAALAEQRLQALDEAVSTRNARILELKQHLSEQQVELEQLRSINAQQAQTIKEMEDNARRQQQAMKDLQDRLDFKVSGLMKVEGQLDKLTSENDSRISELKQAIERLRHEKLEMEMTFQREMVQLQELNRQQQADLEKKAGKIAALVKSMKEKDEALENLKQQQAGSRSWYESASQRLSLQEQEKVQLEAQVQALTLQVANGQKALESLNERFRESMQVNEALKQRGRDAEHLASTRASDLQWQMDRAHEETERAREDMDKLQRRLATVERDNETLRGKMNSSISPEKQSRLISENEQLKAELSESRQLNESLRQSLQELQQQTVKAASAEKLEVERLKAQLRECKQVNDDLQSRIDEVTSAAKAAGIHPGTGSPIKGSRLASEMESWRSQLAEKEHQVRLLQARLEAETSKVASMSLQVQELMSLQERLAEAQKESIQLKDKVANLESKLRLSERNQSSLESLIKSHAKENVELKSQLSDSEQEVKELEAAMDMLQKGNRGRLSSEDDDSLDGHSFDQQHVNGMAIDSEADLARESASLLYSQLEKNAQLSADLCSQLSQLEQSLSVEEPKSTEPLPVIEDAGQEIENKNILSSHCRSQQPAIVITDVDEHASEIVLSQDPTLINLVTAGGSNQLLSQYSDQIRDLQLHLVQSQQSNKKLREQLRSLIQGKSSMTGILDIDQRQ